MLFFQKQEFRRAKNEHLWHQNDSQSLFWFIVPAQRERKSLPFRRTQDLMDKSFHINLHIYRLPEKKIPLKVNNNQMNIPVYSLTALYEKVVEPICIVRNNQKIYSNKFNSSWECVSSSNEIMRKVFHSFLNEKISLA